MKKVLSVFLSAVFVISAVCTGAFASPADRNTVEVFPDTVNPLKAANGIDGDETVTVLMHGGTYFIDGTVNFTSADRSNVSFKAYGDGDVKITNSNPVSEWKETTVNGIKVLEASAGGVRISGLFNGETKLENARLPESGFYTVKKLNPEDDLWTKQETPWESTYGQTSFTVDLKELSKAPSNINDVTVHLPHWWHDEVTGMKYFDEKTGKLGMVKFAGMLIEEGDRFCLENAIEGLDKTGEWCYVSSEDKIYYIPFDGEIAENLVLYAATEAKLINFDGCENITFSGIRFMDTGWEYANLKYSNVSVHSWTQGIDMDLPQSAVDVCSAVTLNNSSGISFTNCDFVNIGTTAVKLTDNVNNCAVESCYFNNIGASGVYIGGQNLQPDNTERTHDITVKNNHIGNYGLQFNSAPGIIITYCDTADISNNEIHDGYYTGISCGWIWLFGYHLTRNINIKDNLIYNIGKSMLNDMGGIYLLGSQPGTQITGNVIHDVQCYTGASGYAGAGIYTDAGASQMLIYQNLVFNCSSMGLNATIARNNSISNNIIAFCGEAIANPGGQLAGYSSMNNFNCNIFLTDKLVPIYRDMASVEMLVDNRNLMWDYTNGDELYFAEGNAQGDVLNLKKAQKKGYLNNPVIADPLFTDAGNYDFTLREDSPAFGTEINFKAWDYGKAGTLKNSTVGVNHTGGQTAYNADVTQCVYGSAQLKAGQKIARFFRNIFAKNADFFRKIFGVK